MDFDIYKAVEDGDPDEFVDLLENVFRKKKLSGSEILGQRTHGGDSLLHVAATSGSEKIVELVASHCPFLLEAPNIKGDTAIHETTRSKKGGSGVIEGYSAISQR